MILRAAAFSTLLIALVLNDCGQQTKEMPAADAPPPAPPAPEEATACVRGTLNDRGVECPAMTTADGALMTLAGGAGRFGPGDEVCVCGTPAEAAYCQQGETIAVSYIGRECPE